MAPGILDINALTTREGVLALRDMVSQLNQSAINLQTSAETVISVLNAEMDSLGPYQSSYEAMMSFARVAILDASGDIDALKQRMSFYADSIENWLNSQKPSDSGSGVSGTGDAWPSAPVDVKKKGR